MRSAEARSKTSTRPMCAMAMSARLFHSPTRHSGCRPFAVWRPLFWVPVADHIFDAAERPGHNITPACIGHPRCAEVASARMHQSPCNRTPGLARNGPLQGPVTPQYEAVTPAKSTRDHLCWFRDGGWELPCTVEMLDRCCFLFVTEYLPRERIDSTDTLEHEREMRAGRASAQ